MVDDICTAFQNHVQPKSNPVFACYKFNNKIQGDSLVEQFVTRLKVLSKECLFEDVEFYWVKQQEAALAKVKEVITQEPGQVLAYYDAAKTLLLQTDSSRSRRGHASARGKTYSLCFQIADS